MRILKAEHAGSKAQVYECLSFTNLTNVTFTSASEGQINGAGAKWWGIPVIALNCLCTHIVLHTVSDSEILLMRIAQLADHLPLFTSLKTRNLLSLWHICSVVMLSCCLGHWLLGSEGESSTAFHDPQLAGRIG